MDRRSSRLIMGGALIAMLVIVAIITFLPR
jgi:hypothetical protein